MSDNKRIGLSIWFLCGVILVVFGLLSQEQQGLEKIIYECRMIECSPPGRNGLSLHGLTFLMWMVIVSPFLD